MKKDDIIDYCRNLYHDNNYSYVRDWKNKNSGMAIGFMPVYVPREIIHASGMLPVSIFGGGENLELIRGDAHFQSYICHIPRSTMELGLSGKLDFLDGMLFPSTCDVIRNLSGSWRLLFKDIYVKYIDYPQNFETGIAEEYYCNILRSIIDDFETLSGNTISSDELNKSINHYNHNRECVNRLYMLRSQYPHIVNINELYLLMRASDILEVTEHTKIIEDYMELISDSKSFSMDKIRIILSGAFCEQPPLPFLNALEESGCFIIDDDMLLGTRYIRSNIEHTEDPVKALSEAYIMDGVPTASRYNGNGTNGSQLVDKVRDINADGVIFAAPSFCDPALLERPMLQRALDEADIPYTSLIYSEDSQELQNIKEQSGTFSDSIRLWGR